MSALRLSTSLRVSAAIMRGCADLEHTPFGVLPHRLPVQARAQIPDQHFAMVEGEPSGVRLVFRTAATVIELDVLPTRRMYVGVPQRPAGIYVLCVDGEPERQLSATGATILRFDMASGDMRREQGAPQTLRFDGLDSREKRIEIWLPHNENTELGALRADAPILPQPDRGNPVWLHYGSSISQGSNASSPSSIWPAVAARLGDTELINLGFGGNALLDPFVARAIRDTKADLISVKIGINLVNTDLMRLRAFGPAMEGFVDTIRDGHPTTPLLVISPLYCPLHETTPGPGAFDPDALKEGKMKFVATGHDDEIKAGKLTLTVIREHLEGIVARRKQHDPNIEYLDGRELFGAADHARLPLPDRLHPDTQAHQLIGNRFASLLRTGWPRT
jgi:hypothetical protein